MSQPRALIVVSTALVSHPKQIAELKLKFSQYDVHQQLAERLDEQAVVVAAGHYDLVHIAAPVNQTLALKPHSLDALYSSLKPGATLQGDLDPICRPHIVIAGFVRDEEHNSWIRPAVALSVPLVRRERSGAQSGAPRRLAFKRAAELSAESSRDQLRAAVGTPKNTPFNIATPTGVPSLAGLGLNTPEEDELINEDDLIDDENTLPTLKLPAKCDPGPGRKRRKACKDCTCGLKEQEEQEEDRRRAMQSTVVSLSADDLAEIDFTVPGKAVGGCGSCALGDAFRCDGCPYLGLPPFKPGEVVSIDTFGDDF